MATLEEGEWGRTEGHGLFLVITLGPPLELEDSNVPKTFLNFVFY
jgi:hypothetical protein